VARLVVERFDLLRHGEVLVGHRLIGNARRIGCAAPMNWPRSSMRSLATSMMG
jgi:hypothetical protein